MATETRSVAGLSEVVLGWYGRLAVEQSASPGAESVTVEADETVIHRIAAEVSGRRLRLGLRMPWYDWLAWVFTWPLLPDKRVQYTLRVSGIDAITVAGSGRVDCAALKAGALRLRISGSGTIDVRGLEARSVETVISGSGRVAVGGSAERLDVVISGSGRVDGSALAARMATARVSGSGRIAVDAAETLDVTITGSGRVDYHGDPRVSTKMTGSGRVRRV
jgi:hypothetical protein